MSLSICCCCPTSSDGPASTNDNPNGKKPTHYVRNFVRAYVQWLHKYRFVLLVLWIAGCSTGGIFVEKFLDSTSVAFSPPVGSPSEVADREKDKLFGSAYEHVHQQHRPPSSFSTAGDQQEERQEDVAPPLVQRIVASDIVASSEEVERSPEKKQKFDDHRYSVIIQFNNKPQEDSANSNTSNKNCALTWTNLTLANAILFPLLDVFVKDLHTTLMQKLLPTTKKKQNHKKSIVDFDDNNNNSSSTTSSATVVNYVEFVQMGANIFAKQFMATSEMALLVPVMYHEQKEGAPLSRNKFGVFLQTQVEHLQLSLFHNATQLRNALLLEKEDNEKYFAGCTAQQFDDFARASVFKLSTTGMSLMSAEMLNAGKSEMAMMDAIVIPIAMCVMGYTVKSLRLLILPLLSIGLSLLGSFAIMYGVTFQMKVSSAAPSLMMSLCIAMGIDYNLFLLSRFVEEVRNGHRGAAAVANTLRTAGHTIFLSGITFICSFVALIFFPTDLLQSYGVSSAITIFISMLISLNLAPSLLLTFSAFFEESAKSLRDTWIYQRLFFGGGGEEEGGERGLCACCCCSCCRCCGDQDTQLSSNHTHNSIANSMRASDCSLQTRLQEGEQDGCSSSLGGSGFKGAINNNSNSPQKSLPSYRPIAQNSELSSGVLYFDSPNALYGGGIGSRIDGGGGAGEQRSPSTSATRAKNSAHHHHEALLQSSAFSKLAVLFRFPANVFVLLVFGGLVGVLAWQSFGLRITDNMFNYLPRGCEQRDVFTAVDEDFGFATIEPFSVMFVASSSSSESSSVGAVSSFLQNESAITMAQDIVEHLAEQTATPRENFRSLFWMGTSTTKNFRIPLHEIQACSSSASSQHQLQDDVFVGNSSHHHQNCTNPNVLVEINSGGINLPRANAVIVSVTPPVDPVGYQGNDYYHKMLDAAKWRPSHKKNQQQEDMITMQVYVRGMGPSSMDALDAIYERFPWIGAASCVAVALVVGIAFRSVVVPLRCILSIAFTEAFVFGVLVLVYQNGIFDFMKDPAVHSAGAVSWLTPIVAFCIVIGVALDYDIFLLTRVTEFISHEGVSTREGTLLGLCATGRIITAAGLIMGIAFFGLMLSRIRILNELGFALVVAVLFDTFVVRTLLVPSVMSLLGKYHWWPSNLETRSIVELNPEVFGDAQSEATAGGGIWSQQNLTATSSVLGGGGGGAPSGERALSARSLGRQRLEALQHAA